MIEVKKVKALRLALHIAKVPDYQAAFQYVKFEAGGRLVATDGFALFVSQDAHDSDETVFVRPEGKPFKIAKNTREVAIDDFSTMVEVGPKGRHNLHPLIVKREGDDDMPTWPDVDRVIPGPGEPVESNRVVDSIRGGDIARVYGVRHGAWLPTTSSKMFHLNGADPGDTVLLVPLSIGSNDWRRE